MASADPSSSINDQAAVWAVEVALGDMTPEDEAMLAAWLATDRRHRGAFTRARAWLQATEDAVVEASGPAPSSPLRPSDNDNGPDEGEAGRRGFYAALWSRALGGGAALAACVAALAATGMVSLPFGPHEQSVRQDVIALADGSTARLSHGAHIDVVLSSDIRRVTLRSGEAEFKVAKDKARPFVVQSGDVYAQATGTVYSVSRVGNTGATVKVLEGSVLVWPRDDRDQAVLLRAGGTVTLDPGPMPARRQAVAVARHLPPPDLAQISLDNVTVETAVARFNRINATKIVVAEEVGKLRIIGLYRANDPEQFAQAVAAISGGRIEKTGEKIVIKMK